jgi:post-segregation antitoxin (ccd killing protein)
LTELKADAAEYVDARGCTALTELKADAAEYVYARGCTALKLRKKKGWIYA